MMGLWNESGDWAATLAGVAAVGRKLQMFLKFIAMARTFALFARARDRL